MKKVMVAGLLLVAFLPVSSATHELPSPVAWWKLDESPNDHVPKLHLMGTATPFRDANAKYGGGAILPNKASDPATAYFTSNSSDTRIIGDLSVFMAFKVNVVQNNPTLVDEGNIQTSTESTNNHNYQIKILNAGTFRYRHYYGGSNFESKASTLNITAGTHGLWLTRDSTAKRVVLKVDGTEFINTTYVNNPDGGQTDQLFVGANPSIGGSPQVGSQLSGGVSELRIWNAVKPVAILDKLANPALRGSSNYEHVAVGDEKAIYYLEPAADESASANDGLLLGTSSTDGPTAQVAGHFNTAYSFDGTDDGVQIPSSASLQLSSAASFGGWVKPSSVTGVRTILEKVGSYALRFNGTNMECVIGTTTSTATGVVVNGAYHHYECTYTGTHVSNFLDGESVRSIPKTGAIPSNSNAFYLGSTGGSTSFASGSIDDVRLYDVALSNSNVLDLFLDPSHHPCDIQSGALQAQSSLESMLLLSFFVGIACLFMALVPLEVFRQ